jgi:REP-associated tyrosine transposase
MFYRRRLPHLQRDFKAHFITFCTYQRRILSAPEWEIVLRCSLYDRGTRYELHVAVVMPDHVHMILTPLQNLKQARVYSLPEILGRIKGASAHLVNEASRQHGTLWQEESFDHVLRSSESLFHKVQCVLDSPVRKGLAAPGEYRWVWYEPFPDLYAPDPAA